MDSRNQRAGVTLEADGWTGDKDSQRPGSTGKLMDEDYATIVDLTSGEIKNDIKAKLTDLVVS